MRKMGTTIRVAMCWFVGSDGGVVGRDEGDAVMDVVEEEDVVDEDARRGGKGEARAGILNTVKELL